ncbi:TlpA family protein disulfide reductase [bacterium]|nr:TlpA family protein disulfide reductase [bacterium]
MINLLKKILVFSLFFSFLQLSAADDYSVELYAMSGNGKLISSDEMMKKSGAKYLIVDFFSLICEPCKRSLPKWDEFLKENKSKGFEFILVALPAAGEKKKTEKDLKNYFKQNKFSFETVFDKYSVVGKKFGVVEKSGDVTLPMIFVVDKSGKLIFKTDSFDNAMSKIQNLE